MTKSGNFIQHLLKHFKSDKDGNKQEDLEKIAAQEQKQFPFETLVSATKDFHPNHKLGQGGFGPVYKGKLDDGREIAVKKLSQSSSQGKTEFMNEAKLLARVQHRNVVTLLGYCAHGSEKLLVYEYVANESLDKLLFKSGGRDVLDWKRRYNIISGIARGLLYLHEDSRSIITHRDIKASNILLDDKWVPKIADFGMARLFPEDQTHVNTRVAGTNGYMAPEYAMHGHLSPKTDVYSFGVVVLELISGQKNSTFNLGLEDQNLLEWAYKLYKKGKSLDIMDPALASSAVVDQVAICVQIGLLCTQSDPQLRPTMRRVVLMLSKKPGTLEEPMRPGYPGSRYRRSRRPNASSSSTAGTPGESDSPTFGSTTNTISHSASTTGSTSYLSSQRLDPHGKRPMQGKIKLNTGGRSKGDPGPAGFGGLFRDESGAWVDGYYGNLKHSTNLEAELWGIYRGLTIIFEKGISNIEIESDSKLAVKLIQEGSSQSFTDRVLVEDSRFLLKRCGCIIKHILREENQCAGLLANTGVDQNEQLVVLEDPPDNVRHLLEC